MAACKVSESVWSFARSSGGFESRCAGIPVMVKAHRAASAAKATGAIERMPDFFRVISKALFSIDSFARSCFKTIDVFLDWPGLRTESALIKSSDGCIDGSGLRQSERRCQFRSEVSPQLERHPRQIQA